MKIVKIFNLADWLVLFSMAAPTAIAIALLKGRTFTTEAFAAVWVVWAFVLGIWMVLVNQELAEEKEMKE